MELHCQGYAAASYTMHMPACVVISILIVYTSDGRGDWTEDGCNTTVIDGVAVCMCNHLTNFAILVVSVSN